MKRTTRILAFFMALLLCLSLSFEAALAADSSELAPEASLSFDETDDQTEAAEADAEEPSLLFDDAQDVSAPEDAVSDDAEPSESAPDNAEPAETASDITAQTTETDAIAEDFAPETERNSDIDSVDTAATDGNADSTETPPPTETSEPTTSPEPVLLPAPKLDSISSNAKGVTITWKAVTGASLYRVFRKTADDKDLVKIGETEETKYLDSTAIPDSSYSYTVCCLTADGSTESSPYDETGLSITTDLLATPVLKSITNRGSALQLTWNPVDGAELYRVFRKAEGDTAWETAGETDSASYLDNDIIPNVKYTYSVRCITADGKHYTSDYDKTGLSIASQALPTPVLKSIANKGYTIKLTWEAVSGAEVYRVYRKADGETKWRKVKNTKNTSFVDEDIAPNMRYTYTVRCLTSDYKHFTSDYDKTGLTITSKKLAKPELKYISRSGSSITLTWGAVSGAEKYRVFRKAEDSTKWTKIADTTKTTYTDSAPNGTKFTYTVRCTSADGKRYTSSYDSKGLTVTIPTINSLAAPIAQQGTAVSGGAWKKVSGSWYYYVDGKAVKDGLYKIDGSNYYFNSKGVMQTGWVKTTYKTSDGTSHAARSFFASSGARKESGWGQNGSYWVYFVNGFTLVDTLYKISGSYYYFDSNGYMATGWTKYTTQGNKICSWFDSDGARKESGWLYTSKNWYYIANGARLEDTDRVIAGDSYHFNSDGTMHTGWLKVTYTDANGKTQSGKRYYLSDGVRCENGSYQISGTYYVFVNSILQTGSGWVDAGNNRFYIKSDGTVRTGWWTTKGSTYYFNAAGKLSTGLVMINGYPYYFYDGTEKNGGAKYTMAKNTTVNGYKINSKGVCTNLSTKTELLLEAQNHSSATNYLIVIDHIYCGLGIYKRDSNGDWYTYSYISCAPGKYSTPTYTGVFKITSSRGYYFDSGSVRCFWYSTFNGNQAIHSVLYYPEGGLADGRLGMRLSHGCVRVSYSNAKWIYDYVPTGTTVVVI